VTRRHNQQACLPDLALNMAVSENYYPAFSWDPMLVSRDSKSPRNRSFETTH
jgi:hypothetical protein